MASFNEFFSCRKATLQAQQFYLHDNATSDFMSLQKQLPVKNWSSSKHIRVILLIKWIYARFSLGINHSKYLGSKERPNIAVVCCVLWVLELM